MYAAVIGSIPSDIVVVGAGAAGLATAIFTRRANRSRAVVVLDGARKPGAKILVSGGSRCNVTNTLVTEHDFWGGSRAAIRRVLRAFPADATVRFFREIGVTLHEEADGKLFPDSNRARDVLDALLREAGRVGVHVIAGRRVTAVARTTDAFEVITAEGSIRAPRVVLATGGRSLPKTGSDGAGLEFARTLGHAIVPTTPALVPLVLDAEDAFHTALSGVAHDVELAVWVDGAMAIRLTGPMLWTHFGVSGPASLNASRHWARAHLEGHAVKITVNFYPGLAFDAVDRWWTQFAADYPRTSVAAALAKAVPASVASALLRRLAIDGDVQLAQFGRDDRRRLVRALVEWPLPVVDTRGYNFAEVTAGGVSLEEVSASTMESRVCPGLYLVGEMLDVDGRLGGFNFQWAWSSAWVAARALARP